MGEKQLKVLDCGGVRAYGKKDLEYKCTHVGMFVILEVIREGSKVKKWLFG